MKKCLWGGVILCLTLVSGLILSGCNESTNNSSPTSVATATDKNIGAAKKTDSVAHDGIEDYPMGNILKLVSNGITLKPDNDKGILGFYIANLTTPTAAESAAGAGALQILVPDAEKSFFSTAKTKFASLETPEKGNPLAPQDIKDIGLDFKAMGWQLSQNGIDENVHSIFFKYNDPIAGEDVFFKVVSKPVTADSSDIEKAAQKASGAVTADSRHGLTLSKTWTIIIIVVAVVISLLLMGGGYGLAATMISRWLQYTLIQSALNYTLLGFTMIVVGGSGLAFITTDTFVVHKWIKVMESEKSMSTTSKASLGKSLLSDDSTLLTYRQLRLEPVTSADVAAYPELKLQPSKAVTDLSGTILADSKGFTSTYNTTGIANYYVSISMLDTFLMPKNTHAENSENPNDLTYLKEDGYFGNRMPEDNYKVMNHYLDGAVLLTVKAAGLNAVNGFMFDAFNQAADEKGYKSNAFINSEPTVGLKTISNSSNSLSTLANTSSLEKGLSYVNHDGLRVYNPININPDDKVVLSVQNPSSNTVKGLQAGASQIKYQNLSFLVTDADLNTGIPQTSSKALSGKDRPLVVSGVGCDELQSGRSCDVSIDFTALSNESSFSGVIYVSDMTSKLTAVPFVYNIQTVLSPSVLTNGLGSDTAEGKFLNKSKKELQQLTLDRGDLSKEATASMQCYDADNKPLLDKEPNLPSNGYCKVTLAGLSDIDTGSYHVQIKSKEAVLQDVPVQVQ